MKLLSGIGHLIDLLIRIFVVIIGKAFPTLVRPRGLKNSKALDVVNASHIQDIVRLSGYIVKEHVVTTGDGYLLVLHKLEKPTSSKSGGKVVYFHHGLLTNSELFVIGSEHKKNLLYILVDLGYEVWLGNNRGNKYSRKHLTILARDEKFWNFSLDEFASYDIPNSINYIRGFYNQEKLVNYIGFSQGCSQLFAALSLTPSLNKSLDTFIGLSPALIPKSSNSIFDIIVAKSANNNNFLYHIFGRKAVLPSVSFWSSVFYSTVYQRIIDISLNLLFGWSGSKVEEKQKVCGYPHLFSNSSVKSLIHWFQIIHSGRFQMFDESEGGLAYFSARSKLKSCRVAPFPIGHHLDVKTVLFYGTNDQFVDLEETEKLITGENEKMKTQLTSVVCEGYEYMDTLWASDVYEKVFAKVLQVLS